MLIYLHRACTSGNTFWCRKVHRKGFLIILCIYFWRIIFARLNLYAGRNVSLGPWCKWNTKYWVSEKDGLGSAQRFQERIASCVVESPTLVVVMGAWIDAGVCFPATLALEASKGPIVRNTSDCRTVKIVSTFTLTTPVFFTICAGSYENGLSPNFSFITFHLFFT